MLIILVLKLCPYVKVENLVYAIYSTYLSANFIIKNGCLATGQQDVTVIVLCYFGRNIVI